SPSRSCCRLVLASPPLQGAAVAVNPRARDLELSARLDFELRSAVKRRTRTPLQIKLVLGLERDALLRRQFEIPLGFERHVLLAFHVDLALRRDVDLGVGLIERDLEVAIAADEGDASFVGIVEEDELVSLARDEATPLDLAVVEQTLA